MSVDIALGKWRRQEISELDVHRLTALRSAAQLADAHIEMLENERAAKEEMMMTPEEHEAEDILAQAYDSYGDILREDPERLPDILKAITENRRRLASQAAARFNSHHKGRSRGENVIAFPSR
ncbi:MULTISPECIES: hypothetical protein [Rhizobium]|uniref:hypothetical protein n=1 Tax=Rhizobium TaxID=379 RepID=UPI00102F7D77|nr:MULTISPECIES: hypothetical protein [Rhizobium]MBY3026629.1 hypothetical protein [Rhizobium leguminosarum]NKL74069.1 hypothetical protein [Rhizobium leguminosarum bv. viciae]TAW15064.1 hypothetical protein ELI25_03975 [Rhizobium ruizarguesonis]